MVLVFALAYFIVRREQNRTKKYILVLTQLSIILLLNKFLEHFYVEKFHIIDSKYYVYGIVILLITLTNAINRNWIFTNNKAI